MKTNLFFNCFLVILALMLGACELTQVVEVDLPDYTSQPVVECYLEPGKPFRLLLTRSYAFFDPLGLDTSFLEKTLINGAVVRIVYDGDTILLPNTLTAESNPLKYFNYTASTLVPATPGVEYTLDVVLPEGGGISGKTTMLPMVHWDSVVVERSPSDTGLYRVLAYMTDDLNATNYYRRLFSINRLDTVPEQDFLVDDDLNATGLFVFGSGYQLKNQYIAYNTIVHISKDYYDFLESVQLATAGNENPFQQPSPIKSNVHGPANPLGIFTSLVYDREKTRVWE
jgi:hypothetical protein